MGSETTRKRDGRDAGGGNDAGSGTRGGEERKKANALERSVSLLSLALLLAAVGYLVWEGTRASGPPAFEASVRGIHAQGSAHHVRFEVRNTGGESVQGLTVRVEARDGGSVVAQAETSLSWLPSGSMRQAAVVLPVDPNAHELDFAFVGYELP